MSGINGLFRKVAGLIPPPDAKYRIHLPVGNDGKQESSKIRYLLDVAHYRGIIRPTVYKSEATELNNLEEARHNGMTLTEYLSGLSMLRERYLQAISRNPDDRRNGENNS